MDADNDEGLFRYLLAKILEFDRQEPQFCRLLMHASLEGNELALMHYARTAIPIKARFREYISRRQAAGAFREMDPDIVLLALAGIPKFFAMQKYMYGNNQRWLCSR